MPAMLYLQYGHIDHEIVPSLSTGANHHKMAPVGSGHFIKYVPQCAVGAVEANTRRMLKGKEYGN